MEISNSRVFAAEVVGTTVLMIGGPGSAILAGDRIGTLGIAFAFGFSLLIMAYAVGHVTGCNINPAVTLGFVLTRKMTWGRAVFYWVGQLLGAAIGGLIIYAIANNIDGFSSKNNFAQNGWGQYSPGGYGIVAAMFVEVVFTALLVYVVLSTTNARFPVGFGGLAAARKLDSCRVHAVRRGYIYVEFDGVVEIERAATNLSEAVWFGCLTGGLNGKIVSFDAERIKLAPTNEPVVFS